VLLPRPGVSLAIFRLNLLILFNFRLKMDLSAPVGSLGKFNLLNSKPDFLNSKGHFLDSKDPWLNSKPGLVNSPTRSLNSPASGVNSRPLWLNFPLAGVNSRQQALNSPFAVVNSPASRERPGGTDLPFFAMKIAISTDCQLLKFC